QNPKRQGWEAGQRVHYVDEEEGIDAIFFIMGHTV
ncbi:hypothetical protein, partial [Kingella kingae]